MKDEQLKQKHSAPENDHSNLDIGTMIEQIWNDLNGRVNRPAIRQVLLEILPEYENARVRRYIPILVHRKAVERLQVEAAEASAARRPSPVAGKPIVDLVSDDRADKPAPGLKTGLMLPGSGQLSTREV